MSDRPWIVFGGGGTGGHLFPALSVVEWLRTGEAVDVTFYCTKRPIDRDILDKAGIPGEPLPVRPFPSRPWQVPGFWLNWRRSVAHCMRAFTERRPAAVVGAGGYASGPPMHAALKMGIPAFLLNPDAVPGRANRHFATDKGLTGVFAQWGVTRDHLPPRAPVVVTGCPVRSDFALERPGNGIVAGNSPLMRSLVPVERPSAASARESFGLDPDRCTLLVTGASQGARTINDAMLKLAGDVRESGWQALHLTGAADHQRIADAYASARTPAVVLAFTDRMSDAMVASDLIISRAGASSLAEILALGRPSILLPYPFHRDRHQWHNGDVLVRQGAAVMLEDHKDGAANARDLRPVLRSLMANDHEREDMARAAAELGHPEAARVIAHLLACVAEAPAGSVFRLSQGDGGAGVRFARYATRACA